MAIVFKSEHFLVVAPEKPHISRIDGGHLVIAPKEAVEDRTQLPPKQAIELMKLTMVVGEAMRTVLAKKGIDLGRINYQDNGNWTPTLHIHLYGRAKGATVQKYGTPLMFPATHEEFSAEPTLETFQPDEIEAIAKEVTRLLATEKYRSFQIR